MKVVSHNDWPIPNKDVRSKFFAFFNKETTWKQEVKSKMPK